VTRCLFVMGFSLAEPDPVNILRPKLSSGAHSTIASNADEICDRRLSDNIVRYN
jgi:hypothetical protein